MSSEDDAPSFRLPTAPVAGPWDHLTEDEKTWIEFIRIISNGSNPPATPARVRALRLLLDTS
jgi:hypothetical protein